MTRRLWCMGCNEWRIAGSFRATQIGQQQRCLQCRGGPAHEAAHRTLDDARRGEDVSPKAITCALVATGDIDECTAAERRAA